VQKYNHYLPDVLLDRVYASNYFDEKGAREVARAVVGEGADVEEASRPGGKPNP
jgi:basic membrane lipoprotein Med (substrate-binding protein (PBP1-ABC) superfamily)